MSEEKKYTERDLILAQREAITAALGRAWHWIKKGADGTWIGTDAIRDEIAPLPRVTRPRVVRDPQYTDNGSYYEWSVRDGALRFRWSMAASDDWQEATGARANMLLSPLPARVALWADLFAYPTQEVDA